MTLLQNLNVRAKAGLAVRTEFPRRPEIIQTESVDVSNISFSNATTLFKALQCDVRADDCNEGHRSKLIATSGSTLSDMSCRHRLLAPLQRTAIVFVVLDIRDCSTILSVITSYKYTFDRVRVPAANSPVVHA